MNVGNCRTRASNEVRATVSPALSSPDYYYSSRTKRIELKPVAGFVVKTTNQTPGVYTPHGLPTDAKGTKRPSNRNVLEVPEPVLRSIPVPAGFKIFLNIAYDDGVPPPPMSSENNIRKAMAGDDDAYYVPVVVSDGRETSDKCLYFHLIITILADYFYSWESFVSV